MATEESAYFSTDLAAITAAVNVAFDVAAIATYLQGYHQLGAYEVNEPPPGFEVEQRSLFLMAVIVSLVLFGGGCFVRSVLAYRIRKGHSIPERLAAAVRAFFQLEVAYMAYQRLPGRVGADRQMLRMVKMVDLAIKMPSTCLAIIMYVMYSLARAVYQVDDYKGLGSTKDLDSLLIVTAVFGILTSSIAAAETLIDKPWSLWHHPSYEVVASAKTKRYSIIRWLATAISLLAHVLVYLLLAPQLRGYTFAVIGGWWTFCAAVYYISCRQLRRSVRCGYLSALMNLPFNPAVAATAVAGPAAGSSADKDRSLIPVSVSDQHHNTTGRQLPMAPALQSSVTAALAVVHYPVVDDRLPHLAAPPVTQPAAAPAAAATAAPVAAAPVHRRCWWLSALLTVIFCGGGMATAVLQIKSCYFTTYRCISVKIGFGIQTNCSLLYDMTHQQQQQQQQALDVRSSAVAQQQLGSGHRLLQVSDPTFRKADVNAYGGILAVLDSEQASSDKSSTMTDTPGLLPATLSTPGLLAAAATAGGNGASPPVPAHHSITGSAIGDSSDAEPYIDYPYDSSGATAADSNAAPSSSSSNTVPATDVLSLTPSTSPQPAAAAASDTSQRADAVTSSNMTTVTKLLQGVKRSVTGTCRRNDTKLEARIGYVTAVFVGLDAFLFFAMCVLAAYGLA